MANEDLAKKAEDALLKGIAEAVERPTTNNSSLLTLAEAYALVTGKVSSRGAHGVK